MSINQNQWEDDDFDFEDEDEQPQAAPQGNDLVKQLRRSDRQKDKRIKEMEAELNSLRAAQRDASVSKVLESEGINPKVSKFIPAEIIEADAVKAWLAENADIVGYTPNTENSNQATSYNDYDSLENMDAVTEGALTAAQVDSQYQQLQQVQTQEDLMRLIMGND
jgi:hypothetical protein